MALIDWSYFIRDIYVANSNVNNPASPQGGELRDFIYYEDKFLTEILGYELYKDLLANLTDVKYTRLIEGAEFTDSCGRLNKWSGFSNAEKISPIANFIYVELLSHRASNNSGVGVVGTDVENGHRTSPSDKIISAWNKMVDLNWVMHDFIMKNKAAYPIYIGIKFPPKGGCGCSCSCGCKPFSHRLFKYENRLGI